MNTDMIKRLLAERDAIMGPVGNPTEEPVTLYTEAAAAIRELQADRDRLRDAVSVSVDAITHAQEGLNAAADDQQDKHGNVMGAAALRALAMLLDISCARSRAALASPPKSGT